MMEQSIKKLQEDIAELGQGSSAGGQDIDGRIKALEDDHVTVKQISALEKSSASNTDLRVSV